LNRFAFLCGKPARYSELQRRSLGEIFGEVSAKFFKEHSASFIELLIDSHSLEAKVDVMCECLPLTGRTARSSVIPLFMSRQTNHWFAAVLAHFQVKHTAKAAPATLQKVVL